MIALLRQQLDAIGVEQLIVAKRGRDRLRAGPLIFQSGLYVVCALPAGLESVDADDLISGEAGGSRNLDIGALEFDFALRPRRH